MTENTDSYSKRKLQGFLVRNPHRLDRCRHLLAKCDIAPDSLYPEETPSLTGAVTLHRRRQWHPTPVFLPGKFHGRRSLVGCRLWGREESDTTERIDFHFSLSCIGEGNGNPLQCSCLESPREGGAWWAALYGVAQSRTRLKRLSSSCPPQRSNAEEEGPSQKG